MLIRGDDKHPKINDELARHLTPFSSHHTQINPKLFFSHYDRPFTQQSLNIEPKMLTSIAPADTLSVMVEQHETGLCP
jgi:hypothetical protein